MMTLYKTLNLWGKTSLAHDKKQDRNEVGLGCNLYNSLPSPILSSLVETLCLAF